MITTQQISDLLNYKSTDYPVVSFYINTDLRHTTIDKIRIVAKDLIKSRRDEIEKSELGHDQKEALKKDFEKILDYVNNLIVQGNQRGLAIFSNRGGQFWQTFTMPQKTKNAIIVDPDPYVRPLLSILNQYHRFCFAIVDRRKAEVYEYYMGEIMDITELFSADVPGKVRIAGWYGLEEKRVMRHIDHHAQEHFKRVANFLFQLHSVRNFDYFILGGQSEYLPEFERHLHPYVADRICERIDTTPHAWDINKIKSVIQETESRLNNERYNQMVDELITDAGKGNRAVTGLDAVLKAANIGNIRLLLIEEDVVLPGRECFSCGYLSRDEEVCPVCGAKTEPMDDLFDEIVENTVNYNGSFYQIPKGTKLSEHGGIGAFLRFNA